jgi:D-alanyl-D-alanine carboxypeptidase (penicillin-binding protein 5/6)
MSRIRRAGSRRSPMLGFGACARRALLALTVVAAVLVAVAPGATAAGPPNTQAPASYLAVDASTGAVVAAANEHVPHLTASTIKILTALVALEHLPPGSPIHVSRLAASQPAMKIDMREGSTWTLEQALDSLLVVSANDAAYALAENAGGDIPHFDTMAAATAHRLGLQDTTFKDPAGLDGAQGFGGGTTSSAYDLAIIARNALAVPAIADVSSKVTLDFTDPNGIGRHLVNHNKGFLTTYPGAIGLKTGYTKAASRTLLAAATRDGHTCVASVMGTWDDTGWASYLLDQCFAGVRLAGAPPLPPVRAQTVQDRLDAYSGLPHPLGTSARTAHASTAKAKAATVAKPTEPAKSAATRPAASRASEVTATAGTGAPRAADTSNTTATTSTTDSGWSWGSFLRIAGFVLLGLLVIVVILRRRAVRRRRARRIARIKAHAEARRRGMIDVVEPPDGSDIRVLPNRTGHHVAAAGRRRVSDRRLLRATRPRDRNGDTGR